MPDVVCVHHLCKLHCINYARFTRYTQVHLVTEKSGFHCKTVSPENKVISESLNTNCAD